MPRAKRLPASAVSGPGLAAHVLAFRRANLWTQEQAAAWWGCSVRQWRRFETGESRVPVPLLKRIMRRD